MSISDTLRTSMKAANTELTLSLNMVNATKLLLSHAIGLRPRLNDLVRWESIEEYEKGLISAFVDHKDVDGTVIDLSLMVVCYGLLEKFVRTLIEKSVEAIGKETIEYGLLPIFLIDENIFRTGQALQSVKKPKRHQMYDYNTLARNLTTCADDNPKFILNASCFHLDHGIVTPNNIDRIFRRVGITLSWDEFGRDSAVKALLNESSTRDCTNAVKARLEDLANKRNIVAHSGGLDVVVESDEFQTVSSLLPLFCRVLIEEVANNLQRQYGSGK